MAQLDEYMKDAEENNLGKDAVNEAKKQAEGQAKKQVKKQVSGLRKRVMTKFFPGAEGAKKTAKKTVKTGAKKVLKAGAGAAKSAGAFLLSNPVGWVATGCIVAGTFFLIDKVNADYQNMVVQEASSELIESRQDGSGMSTELTEDGVAVLMSGCPDEKDTASVGEIDSDASMEANAKAVYSVFKAYGLTDECIAGILSNLQVEASVDPTTIEGIYNEPHTIGTRKKAAFENLSNYTSGKLFGLYAKSGIGINKGAYKASDGKYYCGIGMVQWTGPGAYQMLSVGKDTGYEWYSLEYQLAYMVSDAHYRPGFFAEWKAHPSANASDAGTYFAHKYEGNTKLAQGARREKAEAWLAKMSSWQVDTSYYDSVVNLSTNMGGVAADAAMAQAQDNCPEEIGAYDNSSIAAAAVSYAYPKKAQGKKNNGTALYQQVHKAIFPGDPWFMSCDRSVACAIRWSGSDDTFPPGNTDAQYDYMLSSPKWQSVGKTDSVAVSDLQPGDIFILNGHVFMFTGPELIQQIHGKKADANSDSVSGSLNSRSPGCGNDSSSIIGRGGQDWSGRGLYEVFRCIQPDHSPKYQNAGGSAVLE